jgi:hypothetical protein
LVCVVPVCVYLYVNVFLCVYLGGVWIQTALHEHADT